MLPKRMMYMHPKSKLINAHINENKAVYRVSGSSAAPAICKMLRMALCEKSGLEEAVKIIEGNIRQEKNGDDVESLPFSHN